MSRIVSENHTQRLATLFKAHGKTVGETVACSFGLAETSWIVVALTATIPQPPQ